MRDGKWYVVKTTRPDAGGQLVTVAQCVHGHLIEADVTPTYDYAAAQL
jgi:hypothetical protein